MFTMLQLEHEGHSETDSMSADERLLSKEYDDEDETILQRERVFKRQLHLLAAKDHRVYISTCLQSRSTVHAQHSGFCANN